MNSLSESDFKSVTGMWSWVGGLFPLGAMIGGLTVGYVADRLGRRAGMLFNNILTVIGAGTMGTSYFVKYPVVGGSRKF